MKFKVGDLVVVTKNYGYSFGEVAIGKKATITHTITNNTYSIRFLENEIKNVISEHRYQMLSRSWSYGEDYITKISNIQKTKFIQSQIA